MATRSVLTCAALALISLFPIHSLQAESSIDALRVLDVTTPELQSLNSRLATVIEHMKACQTALEQTEHLEKVGKNPETGTIRYKGPDICIGLVPAIEQARARSVIMAESLESIRQNTDKYKQLISEGKVTESNMVTIAQGSMEFMTLSEEFTLTFDALDKKIRAKDASE